MIQQCEVRDRRFRPNRDHHGIENTAQQIGACLTIGRCCIELGRQRIGCCRKLCRVSTPYDLQRGCHHRARFENGERLRITRASQCDRVGIQEIETRRQAQLCQYGSLGRLDTCSGFGQLIDQGRDGRHHGGALGSRQGAGKFLTRSGVRAAHHLDRAGTCQTRKTTVFIGNNAIA